MPGAARVSDPNRAKRTGVMAPRSWPTRDAVTTGSTESNLSLWPQPLEPPPTQHTVLRRDLHRALEPVLARELRGTLHPALDDPARSRAHLLQPHEIEHDRAALRAPHLDLALVEVRRPRRGRAIEQVIDVAELEQQPIRARQRVLAREA